MIRWVFIAAVLWLASGPGTVTARADDVQVNTYTTNDQFLPSVALDADGNLVVVWESIGSDGTDTAGSSIQSQRYAPNGSPVAGEFQVNTYTSDEQVRPAVAMDVSGDFVVVWQSLGSSGTDSAGYSIQGQRYASDGSPVAGQFQVNTYITGVQCCPSVALDASGDFVVVWESRGSGGTDTEDSSIQGQRYASDGSTLGGEFQVNTYTTSGQYFPRVALDASGDFVIVWQSRGSGGTDSAGFSIQAQRYASDGSPLAGELQVNTYTTSSQSRASVALDADGDFVVVWNSYGSNGTDASDLSIQGQRYASDGSPVASEFQVNTFTPSVQYFPSVALDADGDFVVVWNSLGSSGTDASSYSIQGRRYASDGSAAGGEFQVNTYTTSGQYFPSVAVGASGDFVVAWHSRGSGGTDSSGYSVQRTQVELIFADGFETGDTSAWTQP